MTEADPLAELRARLRTRLQIQYSVPGKDGRWNGDHSVSLGDLSDIVALLDRLTSPETLETMARAYEQSVFGQAWEDDEGWTPDHTEDAVKAMAAALSSLLKDQA